MSIDVEMLTVGPFAENTFLLRKEGSDRVLLIDPGEEHQRILNAVEAGGATVEAILITHCHIDHIGAVSPVAAATGAPVYCPELEAMLLSEINTIVQVPGMGPYENYDPDKLLSGGETLELAGLTLDVIATPGHAPGHITYSVRDENAIFSGDVLFQSSVGRVDLPGGDGPTLLQSIQNLFETHPAETDVYPGHMGPTTLGAEQATNPFLTELTR
jgi:glyoxylase-like metal-dependent hydrolase (beta-lactamase superfamily II)